MIPSTTIKRRYSTHYLKSVKTNVDAVSPTNLSQTIAFLKDFGSEEQAKEALQFYVDNRNETPEFWNLAADPFQDLITDPDVREAFAKKFDEVKVNPNTQKF